MSWGEDTFDRLVAAEPEPLHVELRGVALDAAQRARPARVTAAARCAACSPTTTSPAPPSAATSAGPSPSTGRSLAAGVVERLDAPDEQGRHVRVTVDLQPDFALNQPLAPFALEALELLDRDADTLRRSTCCRSSRRPSTTPAGSWPPSCASPRASSSPSSRPQGIEYEERMAMLETLEHPKPLRDVTYDLLRRRTARPHPWVEDQQHAGPSRWRATCASGP